MNRRMMMKGSAVLGASLITGKLFGEQQRRTDMTVVLCGKRLLSEKQLFFFFVVSDGLLLLPCHLWPG